MIPLFQCCLTVLGAWQFSQFWQDYRALFMMYAGWVLSAQTGMMNLMSMACSRFEPLYLDPVFFTIVLYADYSRALDANTLIACYAVLLAVRVTLYFFFMRSVIN